MTEVKPLDVKILSSFKAVDEAQVNEMLAKALNGLNKKIIVLDDDPTGVQTVNNVSVYTDWSVETLKQGFKEDKSIFFVLTNSRGLTVAQTTQAHKEMAVNIYEAAKVCQKEYIIISRSDSTLRGHYPLETILLKEGTEALTSKKIDGEIMFPFFKEGGRFTINNIHYVKEGDVLTPAGMTEFAKDKSFGYKASHLGEYCEEKSKGEYKADEMTYISLDEIRNLDIDGIAQKLIGVNNFGKVIVNAIDYIDVKIFAIAFCKAVACGKEFMFRSAAAITKVLGGVADKELLTKDELVAKGNTNGGIVLIGSHVKKTTQQFEELKNCKYPLEFIEFHASRVLEDGGLADEVRKVVSKAEESISEGKSVVVFTSRELVSLDTDDKDKILEASVAISDAVTSVIGNLSIKPNFIIAKGGITSSDVGTKALHVKRATVMGQIKPGIPVWMTGEESKFPKMPYVIFPGNVGEITTLKEAVETLMGE
ncbi:MAG: four-carbon acid sugar kinase family protein [Lachnospiraceae bacterium]|nr:four-carbon acid sugar kinase family protein [Lachnospiraceae bacterium]